MDPYFIIISGKEGNCKEMLGEKEIWDRKNNATSTTGSVAEEILERDVDYRRSSWFSGGCLA